MPRSALATAALCLLIPPVLLAVALVPPDTTLNVVGGPDDPGGLLRAAGLALPALLVAVPPGAVAARRFPAGTVLVLGLTVLVAGLVLGRYAPSLPVGAAGRIAQGVGAGLALPATAVLVWERGSRLLASLWAGTLAGGLIVAMPLALHRVPLPDAAQPPDWRASLAPAPWPAVAALLLAVPCLAVARGARAPLPVLRHSERGQIALPAVPAAGLAFLAVVTTDGWSPGAQLVVAGIALVALVGQAVPAGSDASTASPFGCAVVMVSTGLLTYPLAGPLAGLAGVDARMHGDAPQAAVFAVGGAAAVAGALVAAALPRERAAAAVPAGHGLILVAVLLALAGDAPAQPVPMLVPLGFGAGLALAASLRDAGVGAVLFGLGLCFPAVLSGQLLALSLQAGRWQQARPVNGAQRLAALVEGYRVWLLAAGVLTVLLAVVALRARHAAGARPAPDAGTGRAAAPGEALAEPRAG